MDPQAIEKDKLNYLYKANNNSQQEHVPGICQCEECFKQQGMIYYSFNSSSIPIIEALMAWAMMTAQEQHAQAIAEATKAAEEAQKTGQGPKPMMVTPYKHNWVIAAKSEEEDEERMFDWDGIVEDWRSLWNKRTYTSRGCCSASPGSEDGCRIM